jgi:hypothetical protein
MTPLLTWHAAVDVIRNNMAARQTDLRLYLDVVPDPSKVHIIVHVYRLSYPLRSRSFLKELSWCF